MFPDLDFYKKFCWSVLRIASGVISIYFLLGRIPGSDQLVRMYVTHTQRYNMVKVIGRAIVRFLAMSLAISP